LISVDEGGSSLFLSSESVIFGVGELLSFKEGEGEELEAL
jgi:hypothetical protein